jgi:hypothetical protein
MKACRSLVRLTRIGDRAEHAAILACGKTSEKQLLPMDSECRVLLRSTPFSMIMHSLPRRAVESSPPIDSLLSGCWMQW